MAERVVFTTLSFLSDGIIRHCENRALLKFALSWLPFSRFQSVVVCDMLVASGNT